MTLLELLLKLVKDGYQFGLNCALIHDVSIEDLSNTSRNKNIVITVEYFGNDGTLYDEKFSLNDLCSIDSGLWSFVCEKGLVNHNYEIDYIHYGNYKGKQFSDYLNYEETSRDINYRLMLSSIQPDKEKFLLQNIIIPNE